MIVFSFSGNLYECECSSEHGKYRIGLFAERKTLVEINGGVVLSSMRKNNKPRGSTVYMYEEECSIFVKKKKKRTTKLAGEQRRASPVCMKNSKSPESRR